VASSDPTKQKHVTDGPKGHLKFDVVAGYHRDVSLILNDGEYLIGSTPSSAIVLKDAGVAIDHASLHVTRSAIRLEAAGGEVMLGQGDILPRGHGCSLRLPAKLTLGEAQVRIARSPEAIAHTARRFGLPLAVASCVIIAFAVSAADRSRETAGPRPEMLVSKAETSRLGDLETRSHEMGSQIWDADMPDLKPTGGHSGGPAVEGSNGASLTDAGLQLKQRIQAANLHALTVDTTGARVAVSGVLAKRDVEAWTNVQQWFDQAFRGRPLLVANISTNEGRPTPQLGLQAIWAGKRPYVITSSGERFYEGALLNNGWAIEEIKPDRLVLVKNGEKFALTY
jgi:Inner membrane component of T3SS, periplasmic domain/Inner membrane component of T3SS, cytoplasmic domain